MCSCIQVSCPKVSMKSEHPSDNHSPFNRLISSLEFEQCLSLKGVIPSSLLLRVVFKVVLLWCVQLSDVFPAEFVYFSDLWCILLSSLIEVVWDLLYLTSLRALCLSLMLTIISIIIRIMGGRRVVKIFKLLRWRVVACICWLWHWIVIL